MKYSQSNEVLLVDRMLAERVVDLAVSLVSGAVELSVLRAFGAMAAKLLANLIVRGSVVLLRAFSQAYRQAIQNASKTGVAQETVENMARRTTKAMN